MENGLWLARIAEQQLKERADAQSSGVIAQYVSLFCHSKQKKIGNLPWKWAVEQH